MSLYSIGQYLTYRLKAKTRHGIHSPFVYRFIDEGLRHRKGLDIIIRNYFTDMQQVWLNSPSDLTGMNLSAQTEDVLIVVPGIYNNRQHTEIWQKASNDPAVKMSIDLYRYGLLLFREEFKEQQHFVLKFPL